MLRKSVSCMIAGLLIVATGEALLMALFGYWEPKSIFLALGLIFGFAVGLAWLLDEIWLGQRQQSKRGRRQA